MEPKAIQSSNETNKLSETTKIAPVKPASTKTDTAEPASGRKPNSTWPSECQLLVPIDVVSSQRRAEDGTCSELAVECITWAALDAKTGQTRLERRSKRIENALELADAVKQVSFTVALNTIALPPTQND